jgi:cytochrome c-type protein NapB
MRGHDPPRSRQKPIQIVKPINPIFYRRAAWVTGAILVTASFSGYFMGLRQNGAAASGAAPISLAQPRRPELAPASLALRSATNYAGQDRRQDGPNAQWRNHLSSLVQVTPDVSALTNATDAERAVALQVRASRRAYDGAPPVVPHPIAQDSAASCLACHADGLQVKDKVASKVSHAHFTSCTQCHVPSLGARIPTTEIAWQQPIAENQFEGLHAPLKGSRAWPQAPPTVPHPTLMRSDCLSCHGPNGQFGLRTPHPNRQSCTQCHVPAADLNQHQFLPGLIGAASSATLPSSP